MAASYTDIFVVPLSTGQLQFFAVDSGFMIWTCWKETNDPNAAWTPLTEFQMPPSKGVVKICGAPLSDKRDQLFAIDIDQSVWSCWVAEDGSGWTPWTSFPS
jgi:hypothetical protein